MANTLTNLVTDAFVALDVVSRELTGFVTAVNRDSSADRLAINQTLRVGQTPANAAGKDITAAMSLPTIANQTIANKTLTMTKARAFPFSWSAEEQKTVNTGPGYLSLKQDQIAQAIRAAVNEFETDIATAAKNGASRGYGTAGTTPFASDLSDPANIRKILDDNGAPQSARTLVIDTTAAAKLRTLTNLTKANESNDTSLLRQGTLLDLHGFAIRESAQVQATTKGTGASYLVNNASGYAIGDTSIALDTGSGTILAGDMVTFAGDTNKYVVATALAGGVVVLAAPGLRQTLADNVAVTVVNTSTRNIAFSRNAIVAATRLPEAPAEGDLAIMREVLTDPRTGLSFELAVYPGYRMIHCEIGIVWGVSVIKPEHCAVLLG